MKTIVINEYGGVDKLEISEISIPKLNDDEVLIEMHATSINPIDWKVRQGYLKDMVSWQFPITLGWDAAGVVTKVGKNVFSFNIGDEVFTRPELTQNGTYSEYIVVPEKLIVRKPKNVNFEEAASIPLAGLTAFQALVKYGKIKKGNKVLIHAGAGGVGTLAIQIAKTLGAYVTTTASSKNIDFLKSLGADRVIDYKKEVFETELSDYDIVLDSMGGEIQEKSFKVLKKGGVLVSIVQPPNEELGKEHDVSAFFFMVESNKEDLEKLAVMIEKGEVKPIIGQVFKFDDKELQKAHTLSESSHVRGKIVIKIK